MKIKILFFLAALVLYAIWLLGVGTFFIFMWGIELENYEGSKILFHTVVGGMGVGLIYAVYSALDFARYMAKNADKLTSDNAQN